MTTVDVAIRHPVLYVGIYAGAHSPHEKGDFHWAFLIGPSKDRAESEGVRCGIDFHLDSNGRRTWGYNQTIVPLNRQPGLLVRMLLAEIADLRPLGEIIHDHDSTPTAECPDFIGEASEWTSLAWVREKLEKLERKPECFAYECCKFRDFERRGREAAQLLKKNWKGKGVPPFVHFVKICLVSDWKSPDDEEVNVAVKFELTRGRPSTISRPIQYVTGVLGEDTLKMRRQLHEQAIRAKQEVEERTRSKQSEDATTLATARKPLAVDVENVKNVEEQMTMARRERVGNLTVDLPKVQRLARSFQENPVTKKNEENGEQSEDDEDVDEATETVESAQVTTAVNLQEMNKLTRMPGRNSVAEDVKKHGDQSKDKHNSDDDDDVEESDDEDDEEEEEDDEEEDEDDEDDEQEEGKAERSTIQREVDERPNDVRKTAIHLLVPNKPDRAIEEKNKTNHKDEDSSDIEDEDEEEKSEEDSNEDDDEDNDNTENDDKKDGDGDEDDDSDSDSDNSQDDGKEKEEDERPDKEDEEAEDSEDNEEEDEGDDEDDEKDKQDEDEDKDEEDEDEDEEEQDEDEDEDKDEGDKDEGEDKDEDEDEDSDEEEEEEELAGPNTSEKSIPKLSLSW